MVDAKLNSIGLRHGTDKASSHHDYLSFYEAHFEPLREQPLTLLEVGILNGASARTWEEYFPNANIVGADIDSGTRRFEIGRIKVELVDQSNLEDLTRLGVRYGPFDIIIEDGSHMWEHQTTSLRTLFPFLRDGGLYLVEDLQTNYGSLANQFRGTASRSCVDYLKSWLDLCVCGDPDILAGIEDPFLRTYGHAVQFLTFHRHACLIKKRLPPMRATAVAGRPVVQERANGGAVRVNVLAHISNLGDVVGTSGFVNMGTADTFQGIAIGSCDDVLEYRVLSKDGTWGVWGHSNQFVGTRGQSKVLIGATIRLRGDAAKRYSLRVFGRFVDTPEIVEATDNEDCVSPTGGALCALQIDLAKLAGSTGLGAG